MGEAHILVSPARVFARPTADHIWLGAAQTAALSRLSRPARIRALVGPPSSGKSTLITHIAARTCTDAVVLHCRGPRQDAADVLATLLLAADLGPWELSEVEQRNLFTVFVQQRRSQGRRVVIVIDDVHTYTAAALHELERLLAFRIEKRPAIEAMVAGAPSALRRIESLVSEGDLNDVAIHVMQSPSQEDLVAYVAWRLARFELANLITPVASQMIARMGGGRFAAVDVLCQMSLLLLKRLALERVDARVARHAMTTLAARRSKDLEPAMEGRSTEPLDTPPRAYLLISHAGKVMTRVRLGQRTLVGRSEHNDVCLPSPYLSRHHAVIVGTPEGFYVVDLNSINGLSLNGRIVERAVLCDEDLLLIGPYRLKVQIPEWLPHGNPLPEGDSLADTAVMQAQPPDSSSTIRVVK